MDHLNDAVLSVQTFPMVLRHGWTTITFNATVSGGGGGGGGGGGKITEYQLKQLHVIMQNFLNGSNTHLLIRGANATTTTAGQVTQFTQAIARHVFPPISLNVQDKKNISENVFELDNPCAPSSQKSPIEFHEFVFKSIYERTARVYLNATLATPFYIWGALPSLSFDLNAPGIPGRHHRLVRRS